MSNCSYTAWAALIILRCIEWAARPKWYLRCLSLQLTLSSALETGQPNFQFVEAPDEARVLTLLESDPRIDDLDAFMTRTITQAFLVIQDDRILYERYYNGARRDTLVTSFSEAKSLAWRARTGCGSFTSSRRRCSV